jgi:CxxC motif-containing protein (DUF1111 family)
MRPKRLVLAIWGLSSIGLFGCDLAPPGGRAVDPGIRSESFESEPIGGLTEAQLRLFEAGKEAFVGVENVAEDGLGPRFNLNSCVGCHLFPGAGGSSPPDHNPQFLFYEQHFKQSRSNALPPFVKDNGPVVEARFKKDFDSGEPDGGVHALFTVKGLDGAANCDLTQDDFAREWERGNVTLRVPTPTFGLGLIEAIPDQAIIDNHNLALENPYKIENFSRDMAGRLSVYRPGNASPGGLDREQAWARKTNRNGNDGTIARFGWKAQNKSLLIFSGEAYNVEMGISNELFPTEREEKPECQPSAVSIPNDATDPSKSGIEVLSDAEKFAAFMRFLAPPKRSMNVKGASSGSIRRGERLFEEVGCAQCHTPSMMTGEHAAVEALRGKQVPLYSDLALHDMGTKLDDGVEQGKAGTRDFRTAPLWGLGQRAFFLHDGRTNDLVEAIDAHASNGSEANGVIANYYALSEGQRQSLLNFLRSL